MNLKIAILAGDGIGPEVTHEAVNILKAVAEFGGHDFTFTPYLIGGVAIDATGSPLPTATLDGCLESDAVLLGAVGHNKFNTFPPDKRPEAGLLQIRAALGGFANLRLGGSGAGEGVMGAIWAKEMFPASAKRSDAANFRRIRANEGVPSPPVLFVGKVSARKEIGPDLVRLWYGGTGAHMGGVRGVILSSAAGLFWSFGMVFRRFGSGGEAQQLQRQIRRF